jgi:putative hydrolase of the HAD superfamily
MAHRPTVVFDFAGVVFHWRPLDLLQQVIPRHATDAVRAQHWAQQIFQGYEGDWAEFDRGTVATDDLVQRIARRTGLPAADVQAVVAAVPLSFAPIAGTVALIEALHAAGHPLFFLSNMPAPYADHLDATYPFLASFTDGIYSGRVQRIKPERAMFDLAAQRFGRAPADLLFFDDVQANVEAARAAGWQARWFQHPEGAAADLRALGLPGPAVQLTQPASTTAIGLTATGSGTR